MSKQNIEKAYGQRHQRAEKVLASFSNGIGAATAAAHQLREETINLLAPVIEIIRSKLPPGKSGDPHAAESLLPEQVLLKDPAVQIDPHLRERFEVLYGRAPGSGERNVLEQVSRCYQMIKEAILYVPPKKSVTEPSVDENPADSKRVQIPESLDEFKIK